MNKIIFLLIGLILIIGCEKQSSKHGLCFIPPDYDTICAYIYQARMNQLEQCKGSVEQYIEEKNDCVFNSIPKEDFLYEVKDNCLLIITEGERPGQNDWYIENGFTQFNREEIFPIRTWNLTSDQIEDEGFDGWNYWMRCKE